MEKLTGLLTSALTNTTASTDVLPWETNKEDILARVEQIKRERWAMQSGEIPDPRPGHYVRFEAGRDSYWRFYSPGRYYCQRCLDLEKIYQEQDGAITVAPCACVETRRQEARKKQLKKRLAATGLRKKFRSRTFENFTVTKLNRPSFEAARSYAHNFAAHCQSGRSLFLVGDTGRGKTHLAAAIVQDIVSQGYKVAFVVTMELLSDIRATYQSEAKTEWQVLEPLKNVDLLVLDDISALDQYSGWEKGKIYELINMRYEAEKPLVVTCNKMVGWVKERLGEKVVDRLLEMCGDLVQVDGENYRKRIADRARRQDG